MSTDASTPSLARRGAPGAAGAPGPTAAQRRHRLAVRLAAAALVWAAGLAIAALIIPAYNGETVSQNGLTLTRLTLVQSHSAWIVALVMFPLPAALAGLASILLPAEQTIAVEAGGSRFDVAQARRPAQALRWITIAAAALVAVESVLAIASLGAFMLPVAILLGLALALAGRTRWTAARSG